MGAGVVNQRLGGRALEDEEEEEEASCGIIGRVHALENEARKGLSWVGNFQPYGADECSKSPSKGFLRPSV